jgi:sulfite exporter TauE/SafE
MIIRGLVLGFSAGIFCIGFCYPVLAPLMLSKQEAGFKSSVISLAIFILGRLVAYLLFGAIFGLVGGMISSLPSFRSVVLPIAYLILGILMILYGIVTSFPHWAMCRSLDRYFQNRKSNLIFGFLTGINICPPFLLAITTATDLGKPWYGIVFFFFFFLATTVYLLPFLFSGFINKFKDIRIAARVVAVISGLWFIYRSLEVILR